jgi:F0F1-type ATP synthase epsilon subunit
VQLHNVTILADTAARAKDLDEAAALAVKERYAIASWRWKWQKLRLN